MSKARELAELIGNAGGTSEQVLSGRRNLIINGDFKVDQRGYSGTTSSDGTKYTLDRWTNYFATTITKGQEVIDGRNRNFLSLNSASFGDIGQRIEDSNLISGQTISVSFWARGWSGSTDVKFQVGNNIDAGLWDQNFTLTSSWKYYTFTYTVPAFSNVNGTAYSYLAFQSNVAGINWNIAEVQLELGSTATPFEHRSYGEELALCKRYYQHNPFSNEQSIINTVQGRSKTSNIYEFFTTPFEVEMRTTPTITLLGNGTVGSIRYVTTPSSGAGVDLTPYSWGAVNNKWLMIKTYNEANAYTWYGVQGGYIADAEL